MHRRCKGYLVAFSVVMHLWHGVGVAQTASKSTMCAGLGEIQLAGDLLSPDGTNVALAQFRNRPTLIYFWTSRVPFSKNGLSAIEEVAARFKNKGLQTLTVSTDEDVEQLAREVRARKLTVTALTAKSNQQFALGNGIKAIPTTIIVSSDGRVCGRIAGLPSVAGLSREIAGILKQTH